MSRSLLAGAAADRILGDPRRFHPVAAFGRLARVLERRRWRDERVAGAVYVGWLVGGSFAVVLAIDLALRRRPLGRAVFRAAVVWSSLGGRSLAREATRVAELLERDAVDEVRRRITSLVGRDPSSLDSHELCRAAIESVAENTADAVVGPLLWAAVAGPAGAAAYRAANTLDAMVGHRDERYERFGWAAAKLDDLLTWPAAGLAAVLAVLLSWRVGGSSTWTWRTLRRDGAAHPSPNAGRLEATFAGALGVRLGGRNRYGDRIEVRPFLGDGPLPDVGALRRAIRLSELVGLSAAAVCVLTARRLGR